MAALSLPALSAGVPHRAARAAWIPARPMATLAAAFARDTIPRDTTPRAAVRPDTTPRAPVRPDTARRDSAAADSAGLRQLPPDTMVDRLLELEGYTATEYAGDSAQYSSADRTLRLRGDAQVTRTGNTLTARDSLVYQEQSSSVAAYGRPRATGDQAEPIVGEVMFYDLDRGRATVRGAETRINENGSWLVKGDVTSEEQGRRIYARDSEFTSDDRPEPAYHFRAGRVMVVRNRILVGRPATLYFRNVPVMALPFIVQDLERGRRSGFLVPQFELNDIFRTHSPRGSDRGTGREITNIGYYLAISPYIGASLSGGWRSASYTQVNANVDFRWRRRFLDGNLGATLFNREEQGRTYTLNGRTMWKPDERTDLNLSLDFAGSTQFQRDRTVDPFRQTQDLSSTFALTRKLDWGNMSATVSQRQSLANDDRTLTPSFNLQPDPLTLFPSGGGGGARWFNDAILSFGVSASGTRVESGDSLARRPNTEQYSVSTSPTLQFGDFQISTGANYAFDRRGTLDALDTAGLALDRRIGGTLQPVGGIQRERLSLTASTGYQIRLIGSTRLSPSISFGQEFARADTLVAPADTIDGPALIDTLTKYYGTMVAAPARLTFSTGISTDLYGFFPGFGGYSAVRHHFRPQASYNYSPAPGSGASDLQRRLFGVQAGVTRNEISVGMENTFEAKVRSPNPVRGDSMADSAAARGNAAAPQEARKVTLLYLNTSAVGYTFAGGDTVRRFQADAVTNSVRSDLLGGLQFTTSHDLFEDEALPGGRLTRGGFSPYLTSLTTNFSLGANSALFRRLGFGGRPEEERTPAEQRGRLADSAGMRPATPPGNATFTGNNQRTGGGPWNLNMSYALQRTRRATGDVTPGRLDGGNQSLRADLTFYPTRNWAVSWGTQYSLTTGDFDAQSLHFKRDLYRWEANFDFTRAPNGNSSFGFRVHLIDLPDLKADYNERNLGVDRQPADNRRPVARTNF